MAEPVARTEVNTVKYNPHFPNQNQTKHCWVSYVTFKKCEKVEGEGAEQCREFAKAYRSLCPEQWVEKWEDQLDKGTFAGLSIINGGAKKH